LPALLANATNESRNCWRRIVREWVQEKHSWPTNVAVFEKRSFSPVLVQ